MGTSFTKVMLRAVGGGKSIIKSLFSGLVALFGLITLTFMLNKLRMLPRDADKVII